MSSGLSTGMRDDEQCQAACEQVCEMINKVKRFGSRGPGLSVICTCNLFCSHQQEIKLVRTFTPTGNCLFVSKCVCVCVCVCVVGWE